MASRNIDISFGAWHIIYVFDDLNHHIMISIDAGDRTHHLFIDFVNQYGEGWTVPIAHEDMPPPPPYTEHDDRQLQ